MILDDIANAQRYVGLHRGFAKAFAFLQRKDLAALPDGRHEVDGREVYAIVYRGENRGHQQAKLEVHKKYIDIQFCLAGTEEIGWKPTAQCHEGEGFDEAKDMGLFTDEPVCWFGLQSGTFSIFFPADAHAPMAGSGPLHKIIVKVAEELYERLRSPARRDV